MTPISYLEVFKALNSEAMLAVAALAALTLDLASLRRAEPIVRRRTIGTVAVIGLLASVIPLWAAAWPFPISAIGRHTGRGRFDPGV